MEQYKIRRGIVQRAEYQCHFGFWHHENRMEKKGRTEGSACLIGKTDLRTGADGSMKQFGAFFIVRA